MQVNLVASKRAGIRVDFLINEVILVFMVSKLAVCRLEPGPEHW